MIVDFGKKRAKFSDDIVNTLSKDLLEKYYSEINKYQPLSKEEERELFVELNETKDEEKIKKLKDKIVKHNLLFVVSVARTYAKRVKNIEIGVEELICEGNLGLYEAIDSFKIDKDNKFISYAVWHIRRRILGSLSGNSYFGRVSENVKTKIREVNVLRSEFEKNNNCEVDYEYIIEKLDIGGDKLKKNILMALNAQTKGRVHINEDVHDLIKCDDLNEQQNLVESNNIVKKAVDSLTGTNRVLISHYFGLFNYEELTINEIAEKYAISRDMVSKRIKKSIQQLKKDSKLTNYFLT
jgi:RNA polymerase sigma factor (sigma-70 family)